MKIEITKYSKFDYLGSHYDGGKVKGLIDGKPFKAKYIEEGTHDNRLSFTRDQAWVEGEEVTEDFPFAEVKALVWAALGRA